MMRFKLGRFQRLFLGGAMLMGLAGVSIALANEDDPPLGGPRAKQQNEGQAVAQDADAEQNQPGDRPGKWRERRRDRRRAFDDDAEVRPGGFKRPRDRWAEKPEIPEEVLAELREAVRVEMPELYERMQHWRERDPDRYDRALRRFYPALREYMVLREQKPELARTVVEEIKIEMRLRRLGREYAGEAESSPRRLELDQELNELVRRQIALRVDRRTARLQELEERLQREKTELETQKAGVETMVTQRLERIKRGEFDDAERVDGHDRPLFGRRPHRPHHPPRDDMKRQRGDKEQDAKDSDQKP